MNIFILTLFSLLTFSSQAVNTGEITLNEKATSKSRSSKENREGKRLYLGFSIGRALGLGASSGEINYYHNSNFVSFFRFGAVQSEEHLDDGFTGAKFLKLGVKKYTGNSFYYTIGVFHRQLDTRVFKWDNSQNYTIHESMFRDLGVSTSIGNHWHWKNFSLNIDYIGINRTLVEIDEMTKPFKRVTKLTFSILNLGLGYAF